MKDDEVADLAGQTWRMQFDVSILVGTPALEDLVLLEII